MATKPTSRQLSYLKSLANRTGQTFTYPHTAVEASAQINRLKHTRPSTRTERRVEGKLIADHIQAGPIDSARVRNDEISGHGSSATWTQNRAQEPPPPEDPGPDASVRRAAKVGERTELARYATPAGQRVVYGQRVEGLVRVTDRPSSPGGRSYLIERELQTKSELNALVTDYLATAQRLQAVPMNEVPLEAYLESIT